MRQLDEFLDPKLGARPRGKRHLMPVCCDDGVCAGRLAVPPSQQACKRGNLCWFLAKVVTWCSHRWKVDNFVDKAEQRSKKREGPVCVIRCDDGTEPPPQQCLTGQASRAGDVTIIAMACKDQARSCCAAVVLFGTRSNTSSPRRKPWQEHNTSLARGVQRVGNRWASSRYP